MRRALALTALGPVLALVALLAGCQSTRSWRDGCPGIYSGLRYYHSQLPELPFDGKVFFTFDLLPSAVVDTLALPFTSFAHPVPPPEGYVPGCRWAEHLHRRRS